MSQALFWKYPPIVKTSVLFQDADTGAIYNITVSDGVYSVTELVASGTVPSFAMSDISTGELWSLAILDGALTLNPAGSATNILAYIPLIDPETQITYNLGIQDGVVCVFETGQTPVLGLVDIIPGIYSTQDTDGSFAKFVSVYDAQHTTQRATLEQLATIRTPSMAPLSMISNIADSLGSPFPFMSAERWQRGNKLAALPFIYSQRGSKRGIQDTILFLTGVKVIVEADVEYTWVLGSSRLP